MTVCGTSTLTVDLDCYAANLAAVRARIDPACAVIAVVKANAYGLGAVPVARRAVEEGAAMLAVATVAEGIALRDAGLDTPILVVVQPRDDELAAAVRNTLRIALSDLRTAELLGEVARKARTVAVVHCEIDTGMGRQGFPIRGAAEKLRSVTRISNVDIEGVFTHFACADRDSDSFTESQLRSFRDVLKQLDKEGVPYETVHAANSAAVVNYPQSAFGMVRPGLMTYGVWPAKKAQDDPPLQAVGNWSTTIVLLRDIPSDTTVSYGATYRATKPGRIAAIPVGYADGYPVALSNRSDVIIRGSRCPVRGQVTMNEFLVDVTLLPDAVVGDRVTLIGTDGHETITVEELAAKAGTIPYEILTGIGPAVTRNYTN